VIKNSDWRLVFIKKWFI